MCPRTEGERVWWSEIVGSTVKGVASCPRLPLSLDRCREL